MLRVAAPIPFKPALEHDARSAKREAKRRNVKLLILPTVEAIEELKKHPRDTKPSWT